MTTHLGNRLMNCQSESRMYANGMMADAARLSLAASAGGFATAGFGCMLNQFVPDAICVEGLAIVACFFLVFSAVDHFRVRWGESRSQRWERAEALRSVQAVQTGSQAIEAEVAGESS